MISNIKKKMVDLEEQHDVHATHEVVGQELIVAFVSPVMLRAHTMQ